MLLNADVIPALIVKITQNSMGTSETFFFISIDEAVLHVITQSSFLSWDLQNFIYLMSLMTIS